MVKGFGLVFGGFVFLQGRPNLKMLANVWGGKPSRFWGSVGWLLIFKFHRVFLSYVFIPAFVQGDQFH